MPAVSKAQHSAIGAAYAAKCKKTMPMSKLQGASRGIAHSMSCAQMREFLEGVSKKNLLGKVLKKRKK